MRLPDKLLRAAAARDHAFLMRPLILAGADPYSTDEKGRTAFNCAASSGLRALHVLTDLAFRDTQKSLEKRRWKDFALNTPSGYYGSTLITYAAKVSSVSLVKEMVAAGADITIVNGSGWTLLHCAAVMPGRAEVIKILTKAFRDQGLENLVSARSTHLYETDYGSGKVVYGQNLTAAGLCRARVEQDAGCPEELSSYITYLE
jgi:ankyrin repeat protein